MKLKDRTSKQNIIIILIILLICGVMIFYQTKKEGIHEDEGFTLSSAVNPVNGLMYAYEGTDEKTMDPPIWKSREYVTDYFTLSKDNYLNLTSVYLNQAKDNHPPIFYMLVHFSTMLFGGRFSIYSVFVVNISAFILSCFVIKKILKAIDKENVTIPTLILYGMCMGTISMVIYQRMYMLLTLFVLLYFYYNIKIYKNNFEMTRIDIMKLGLITIGGFLTQYFFATYALGIFLVMIVKMHKNKKRDLMKKYINVHFVYALLGIILFPSCIYHLLFSGKGIINFGKISYFENFLGYINQLEYIFSIQTGILILYIVLVLVCLRITKLHERKNERFILMLGSLPTLIFFVITTKVTPFPELRYIMPVIPVIVLNLYIMLDILIDVKYKEVFFIGLSMVLVILGMLISKPKFLYEDYKQIMKVAEENKDKSFVYIYDNFFNHMQSIPEMLTYKRTLIVNETRNDEVSYVINDNSLNNEESYILCIKSYLNNEEILERIRRETDFKNITTLYLTDCNKEELKVESNLYLVSK